MDESVGQIGSGVDYIPPTWRDTTVLGGGSHANVEAEGEKADIIDERAAHKEAHQSTYVVGKGGATEDAGCVMVPSDKGLRGLAVVMMLSKGGEGTAFVRLIVLTHPSSLLIPSSDKR
jgi:hypothetical protein